MITNWTEYFLEIAEVVKQKSKDKYTQIGTVIVNKSNSIISTGYNSFPRGIDDTRPERQERPEKYFWMAHSERNAIDNAARIGVSTEGCTMYCTCDIPCTDCMRGIINAGISKIVYCVGKGARGEKWVEDAVRSIQMANEAGIERKIIY